MNIITLRWVASPVFGVIRMSQMLIAPIRIGRMLMGNPSGEPMNGTQLAPASDR